MDKLIVFSGAGISAESGISTFRDVDGLWEKHKIEDVADFDTWRSNFDMVHKFYDMRREAAGKAKPNIAHEIIADWETRYDLYNITQNVDDLFEQAGCQDVLHIHGFLREMKCYDCNNVWEVGYRKYDPALDTCSNCGEQKSVKPNVVFFGENAPLYDPFYRIMNSLTENDVVVAIGTSSRVVDIDWMMRYKKCLRIRVNNQKLLLSGAYDYDFIGPATKMVPIVDGLLKERFG